jgi:hypothetical protein
LLCIILECQKNLLTEKMMLNVRDTADDVKEGFDEAGDKIKAGTKAMGNKIKDPDTDLGTGYKEEKFKEEVKDI